MSVAIAAAVAVLAAGAGVVVWIGIGRVLEQVDQLPANTPVAFLQAPTTATAAGSSVDAAATGRAPIVVVCLGDSITHGTISSNYVESLASRFDAEKYDFVNAGINGDLAYNALERLDEVIECKPDVVTILIGTNDANALTNQGNLRRYMKEQHLPKVPDEQWYRDNLTRII